MPVGRWCVIRDGGCVSPQCLTTYLLVQACQHLWLVASYDLYQHFTWVDHVPDYWLPTAVMLAVAESAGAFPADPRIEAALSPRLRTSSLPATPAGVADRWRNIG